MSADFFWQDLEIHSFTASSTSPASINDGADIKDSAACTLYDLVTGKAHYLDQFDAVLVACYSVHTLVTEIRQMSDAAVLGIFEASILSALSLTKETEQWGIVTTGQFWEKHLGDGVNRFLGQAPGELNSRFAGVFSSGLTAGDFHTVSPEQVREKLRDATIRLLKSGNVSCVAMGCGGMAGLEDIIRSAAVEIYGQERANKLYIVDGVQAGILQLHQTIHSKRAFM